MSPKRMWSCFNRQLHEPYSRYFLMSCYLVSRVGVQLNFKHLSSAGINPLLSTCKLRLRARAKVARDLTLSSANQSHIWPRSTRSSSCLDLSEPSAWGPGRDTEGCSCTSAAPVGGNTFKYNHDNPKSTSKTLGFLKHKEPSEGVLPQIWWKSD